MKLNFGNRAKMAKTLYDKIWDDHLVDVQDDGTSLLYIDRHLIHEVTSPQAFEGLRMSGRKVRAPEKTLAVVDHNVPTTDRSKGIDDPQSKTQIDALAENCAEFGIEYLNELDPRQGVVHIIGPEQGFTLPGTTIVCGDSHTSTHGAFGALAHGIGTSEVEHVLATQTLIQAKAKNMAVHVTGTLPDGVTAKDIILAIIGEIGTAGGTGHVIEYMGEAIRALSIEGRMTVCNGKGVVHIIGPEQGFTLPGTTIVCGDSHTSTHGAFGALAHGIGTSEVEHVLATQTLIQAKAKNMAVHVTGTLPDGVTAKDIILAIIGEIGTAGGTGHVIEYMGEAIRALSIEGRMTVCNMSIEGGARAGLIAPDEKTFDYLQGRPRSPKGAAWEAALAYWSGLHSDEGAHFDKEITIDAGNLPPIVTWGTSPEDVIAIGGSVPDPSAIEDAAKKASMERALDYMGLTPGTPIKDITIDRVFIGSCTNGRIEDLRAVADVVRGHRVNENVNAMIVPGSGLVKEQAEQEGLDDIFKAAGFEWREPGCSMCLAMNADKLEPKERCASTSNRNFEGRQGRQGRTHLVSPAMAAAAAIAGHFVDIREFR